MKKLTVLLFLGLATHAWAIETERLSFEELLEDVYCHCTEEIPYEVLEACLWEYYHTPFDLNQATEESLRALGILTEEQLDQFFSHVAKYGPLISVYELQAIPAFDLPTIRRLLPFVTVVDASDQDRAFWPAKLGSRTSYGLMRYEQTLETKKGYLPNHKDGQVPYAGSPAGGLARLHIKQPSGGGEVGLSTRKRAGEAFTWDPATRRYGGSLQRFHGILRKNRQLWVVGDYSVGYGEGLLLHAGFSMNKSSETMKVIRTNNRGIRPHTALHHAAFRGIATTWQWEPLEWTIYGSMVDLDGKVKQDDDSQYVSGITRGGYYRTKGEIAKKGQIGERLIGSTLVYKFPHHGAFVGMNALYTHYSIPIRPNPKSNPLRFTGQNHMNTGIFYRYLWHNFHFFGEGAVSKSGDPAVVSGVVASLSRYVDATLLGRYYGQGFYAPYGKAFRENSQGNSNEWGIYLGARIRPWQWLYLDTYYDYFSFPWYYGRARDGHSWLAKATYQHLRTSKLSFQYKGKIKPRKIPRSPQVENGTKHNCKLRYQYTLNRSLSFNSEIQWSSYRLLSQLTQGYAAVQEVGYKIRQLQLKAWVAWFRTEDYANRLFFYEPNVLYSGFNFPAYQGRGMRYGLLVCYKPVPALRIEMKYTLTHYHDRDRISSGREEIAGNVKNEVGAQAIFRF